MKDWKEWVQVECVEGKDGNAIMAHVEKRLREEAEKNKELKVETEVKADFYLYFSIEQNNFVINDFPFQVKDDGKEKRMAEAQAILNAPVPLDRGLYVLSHRVNMPVQVKIAQVEHGGSADLPEPPLQVYDTNKTYDEQIPPADPAIAAAASFQFNMGPPADAPTRSATARVVHPMPKSRNNRGNDQRSNKSRKRHQSADPEDDEPDMFMPDTTLPPITTTPAAPGFESFPPQTPLATTFGQVPAPKSFYDATPATPVTPDDNSFSRFAPRSVSPVPQLRSASVPPPPRGSRLSRGSAEAPPAIIPDRPTSRVASTPTPPAPTVTPTAPGRSARASSTGPPVGDRTSRATTPVPPRGSRSSTPLPQTASRAAPRIASRGRSGRPEPE